MSMHDRLVIAACALALGCGAALAESPDLGRIATPEEIAAWDIRPGWRRPSVRPGNAAARRVIYAAKCVACRGEKGAGKPNDQLVGGRGTLGPGQVPVRTVGSFWPYATTLFDYVRRAMPLNESKSLSSDQTYAVVAYILHLNGVIAENGTLNDQTLPRVEMPNRDGFVLFWQRK